MHIMLIQLTFCKQLICVFSGFSIRGGFRDFCTKPTSRTDKANKLKTNSSSTLCCTQTSTHTHPNTTRYTLNSDSLISLDPPHLSPPQRPPCMRLFNPRWRIHSSSPFICMMINSRRPQLLLPRETRLYNTRRSKTNGNDI